MYGRYYRQRGWGRDWRYQRGFMFGRRPFLPFMVFPMLLGIGLLIFFVSHLGFFVPLALIVGALWLMSHPQQRSQWMSGEWSKTKREFVDDEDKAKRTDVDYV